MNRLLRGVLFLTTFSPACAFAWDLPRPAEINGQKVLTLVSRDAPGVRCNTNIRVAAEIQNHFKVPLVVLSASMLGVNAKAPAVYYGEQVVAIDGGEKNGMLSFTELNDFLEMENAPRHEKPGRLTQIQSDFDSLKAAIKAPK